MTEADLPDGFISALRRISDEALVLRLWHSGRELFHSNVLAYLLESEAYGPRLLEYLWGDSCSNYHVRALREQNGIDLLVLMLPIAPDRALDPKERAYWSWLALNAQSQPTARVLAIENKFKSLPDPAQLQGYGEALHNATDVFARKLVWYSERFQDAEDVQELLENDARPYLVSDMRKVILTPADTVDVSVPLEVSHTVSTGARARKRLNVNGAANKIQDCWQAKSWRTIAERLGANPAPVGGVQQDLESQFVQSYRRSLESASAFQQELQLYCDGPSAFAELDLLRRRCDALRLTDFLEKWRYEILTRKVRAELVRGGWNHPQLVRNGRGKEAHFRVGLGERSGTAIVGTFFSRGSGGTDIGLLQAGQAQFAAEVQLQGATLKLMFAFPGPEENEPQQQAATLSAVRALVALNGPISRVFTVPVDVNALGRYVQEVSITASAPIGSPPTVEIQRVNGRLLYARASVWTRTNGGATGPWSGLSCDQVAAEIASIALEFAGHWDLVRQAAEVHLSTS